MELSSVKFIMSIIEPIKPNELIQQAKEKGFLYSNSAIKCSNCKVIFPAEYEKCPQCEIVQLWKKMKIHLKINFDGKQN